MGNSCYTSQFQLLQGQKTREGDGTLSKSSGIAVSDVISMEKAFYSNTVDLFSILDAHEIDSYFEEALYFLDFHSLKENSKIEASYFNAQFDALQSIWYRLEDDCVSNKLHTIYSETEFGFQPELIYFKQFHELRSKKADPFYGCAQENLAFAIKDDTILSVDKVICPKIKGSSDTLTFIFLRGVKRIGQSNYIEFQKSLVFTSLTSHPKLWEVLKAIKNPGLIHLNCSRHYTYKGRYFRRSYCQFDIGHTTKLDVQSSCLSTLSLVMSEAYLQRLAKFAMVFKSFAEIKWPDCSFKDIKAIFSKGCEYFSQKNVKYIELQASMQENVPFNSSQSTLNTSDDRNKNEKIGETKGNLGSDRLLLNSVAVIELQKKLEQSLLSGFDASSISFADEELLESSLKPEKFAQLHEQPVKISNQSTNELKEKPNEALTQLVSKPQTEIPSKHQSHDKVMPKPYQPQLQPIPKKTILVKEQNFDFQYVKNPDLLIDLATKSPNSGFQTIHAKTAAFTRKKETQVISEQTQKINEKSGRL